MLWRNAQLLWLLVGVASLGLFLVLAAKSRSRALLAFAETGLIERLVVGLSSRRRGARVALRLAALVCLVAAIAGPRWGFRWEEIHRTGIDLIIALDTSRSMLASDVKPNRLERAKLAVLDLVDRLRGDRIGLVAFSGAAFLECPLTLDYAAFERSLRATHVGIIPRGGTALARAIDTSLDAFEARQGKYEALVLITDGEDHEGDVAEAAQRAAAAGVKIYTVGIGTAEGEIIPVQGQGQRGYVKDDSGQVVKSRLDEGGLRQIALATGGAHVRGLGAALGLDEVFDKHIAKMERRDVGTTLERRYEKRFQLPLAAALVFLLLEALVGVRSLGGLAKLRSLVRRGRRLQASNERTTVVRAGLLIFALPFLTAWFDASADVAHEGNRLYGQGDYSEAVDKYREGLIDLPDSLLLQFNLGTALYREGKFDEAVAAFGKVATDGDDEWTARAAYNLGNTHYEVGKVAEDGDPQAAIMSYEQALFAYRRSMAAVADDDDPRYGHEFVAKALEELQRRLEEQEQEQQEQQDEQGEQDQEPREDQEQDQQSERDQQDQQDQQNEEEQPEEPPHDEAGGQGEEEQQQEPQPQDGGAQEQPEGEPTSDETDREQKAAHAILDLAGSEELGPDEVQRNLGVAGVGEPTKDW